MKNSVDEFTKLFKKNVYFHDLTEYIKNECSPLGRLLIQQNYIQYNLLEILKLVKIRKELFYLTGLKNVYSTKVKNTRRENLEGLIENFKKEIEKYKNNTQEASTMGKVFGKIVKEIPIGKRPSKKIWDYISDRNKIMHRLYSNNFRSVAEIYLVTEIVIKKGEKLTSPLKHINSSLLIDCNDTLKTINAK